MYGIVNKAIQELITENFGADKWAEVKNHSGVDIDFFINSEPYDDDVTFSIAQSASIVLGMPLSTVFFAFGEWWVLRTGKEKYGGLMEAGGNNLREFLVNLPLFHNRIMLIYPKLTPPEFKVSHVSDNSVNVHYYSQRQGLRDFVHGLLSGLAKMYNQPVEIELIESRELGSDHEVFKVKW